MVKSKAEVAPIKRTLLFSRTVRGDCSLVSIFVVVFLSVFCLSYDSRHEHKYTFENFHQEVEKFMDPEKITSYKTSLKMLVGYSQIFGESANPFAGNLFSNGKGRNNLKMGVQSF